MQKKSGLTACQLKLTVRLFPKPLDFPNFQISIPDVMCYNSLVSRFDSSNKKPTARATRWAFLLAPHAQNMPIRKSMRCKGHRHEKVSRPCIYIPKMILAILPVFTGLKSACSICYNQVMKKSKYRNKKTYHAGMVFDSRREFERWLELRQMEKFGKIKNLERQKAFILIDKSEYGRRIVYKCDFAYQETSSGAKIVEDVKSPITQKNPVYRLKKRLLAERYGIVIHEVF